MPNKPIPSAAIGGRYDVYYGDPSISPPVIGTPIRASVARDMNNTIVNATCTRGSGSVLFDESSAASTGFDAGTSDLEITTGLSLEQIDYWPNRDDPVRLTQEAATPTVGFADELASGQSLHGKSLYIQNEDYETAELKFSDASGPTGATGAYVDFTIENTTANAAIFAILDSIRESGDEFRIRIADEGGTELVPGSNSGWSLIGDGLIGTTGVQTSWQQNVAELEVLARTVSVDAYRTKEIFQSTFNVQSFRPDTLAVLMNRASVVNRDPTTTSVGYREIEDMYRGHEMDFVALCVRGETTPYPTLEAGADAMVQWTYYKGFFSSNIDFGLMAEPSGFDVTYTAIWDDVRDSILTYQAQNLKMTV